VERLLFIGGLFVLAGLCEIGGGYLVWGWMHEHKPLLWALIGAAVLAAYGVVAAMQPISEFGRVLRCLRWHLHRALAGVGHNR
jgi:small multidrug resistance family-3 protein